ncbi:hypothetical protein O6H91_13G103700 [Diphasiastrum complanatum]|uniref:Uncharacterized protein n=1 Tax=Diphasiastrum complanatum TaxID=34168 RepID=A0ACC2BZ36_DIPCM|nr:hypothetical protein O6H91_13G103700 [Diphasiastrum complanatum]
MAEYRLQRREGGVYILTFGGDGEHRLNPDSVNAILTALDEVENDPSATALITTNEGKYYSNGLDLFYLRSNLDKHETFMMLFHKLLRRLLSFPMPTFAAICGHAAAGGCIVALAHDYRLLRSDRGFVFLNEVEIAIVPSGGVLSLIHSKLPNRTYQKALLSGHRYSGQAAVEAGLVDAALPDTSSTLQETIKRGRNVQSRTCPAQYYRFCS